MSSGQDQQKDKFRVLAARRREQTKDLVTHEELLKEKETEAGESAAPEEEQEPGTGSGAKSEVRLSDDEAMGLSDDEAKSSSTARPSKAVSKAVAKPSSSSKPGKPPLATTSV